MKRLILIRHGQSEANINYDIMQHVHEKDIQLTAKGYHDAVQAGVDLKSILKEFKSSDGVGIDEPVFIVSPWTRAHQTYRFIAAVLNIPEEEATIHDDVVEHHMNLPGNPANWEKFVKYRDSDWNTDQFMHETFEGGETLANVQQRAKAFLGFVEELAHGIGYNNIVLVAHGKFIKMVVCELDGIQIKDAPHPKNGEIIIREIK